jgi:hypothetical protein
LNNIKQIIPKSSKRYAPLFYHSGRTNCIDLLCSQSTHGSKINIRKIKWTREGKKKKEKEKRWVDQSVCDLGKVRVVHNGV